MENTLTDGGRIRLQVAHRAGLWVKEYGPESGAYAVAVLIMQSTYEKVTNALDRIEQVYLDAVTGNLRRG